MIKHIGEFSVTLLCRRRPQTSTHEQPANLTLTKDHEVPGYVEGLSQEVTEVREPGFRVPNLLDQLPVVQAMPHSRCTVTIIQDAHRAWNASSRAIWNTPPTYCVPCEYLACGVATGNLSELIQKDPNANYKAWKTCINLIFFCPRSLACATRLIYFNCHFSLITRIN